VAYFRALNLVFIDKFMKTRFTWPCFSPVRLVFPIAGVFLVIGVQASRADLLVYEGFDYPPGPLVSQAGGKGWNEPWHGYTGSNGAVAADSLKAAQPVATTGGHMETVDPDSPMQRGLEHRLFDKAGVVWLSVLIRNDSGQSDATYSFLSLGALLDKKSAFSIGKAYNVTNWGVTSGSQSQTFALPADNTVALIVLRIEHSDTAGSDSIQAFINPPTGAEPTTPYIKMEGLTLKPVDLVSIRSGNNKKIFSYDEIRIGTTFADVAPPATPGGAK
jgi:hypothetical protein